MFTGVKMPSKFKYENHYKSIEDLYKRKSGSLIKLASDHLSQSDLAIDAVHDALAKALVYFNKRPKARVSEKYIRILVIRACRKKNKDRCGITMEPITDFTKTYQEDVDGL